MKLRALLGFSLGGGVDVATGQVFELPDKVAKVKILMGYAEPVVEEAAPVAAPLPEPLAEPEIEPVMPPLSGRRSVKS